MAITFKWETCSSNRRHNAKKREPEAEKFTADSCFGKSWAGPSFGLFCFLTGRAQALYVVKACDLCYNLSGIQEVTGDVFGGGR